MMKNIKRTITAAAFCFIAAAASAVESNIYPLPAVFTSKNINNARFENLFKSDLNYFINTYVSEFNKAFPNSANEITDTTKYNTFAAYMSLPRVSENNYNKGALVDVYLPMTASLNFVNMATSEILYSESLTKYAKYKTTQASLNDASSNESFSKLYKQTYSDIVKDIIGASQEKFKPYSITVNVIDKYKDLYVLDKGLTNGVAKGDVLTDSENNQLSVVYADLDYAVATSIFGSLKKNTEFVKYTNASVSQLKKPKVLFVNDFSNEKIYNLFSAALGSNADFSLITVDKSFYDMQAALVSLNPKFKQRNLQNREVPDYFFKLSFTPLLFAEYPTNKSFYKLNKYGIFVCGNIFDKTGQVVYATCVNDELSDEAVADIKFSDEAQYEIVTKNAFAKLAEDIAQNVKFKSANLEISKVTDNSIFVKDPNHVLNYGSGITVMKKVKTENAVSDVTIPTWTYNVKNINGSEVECTPVSSIVDNLPLPSKKDIVKVNTITRSKLRTTAYDYMPEDVEIPGNEVKLKYFNLVAIDAISSKINLPVSVNKDMMKAQIEELNAGYGFKRKLTAPETKSENSINAKYKIKLLEEKKKGNLIEQKYEVICGVVVKSGNNAPKKSGLRQEVTITLPPTNNEQVREYELLKFVYSLMQSVVKNI